MDGATYSPYLRYSWFHFRLEGNADYRPFAFHMQSSAHVVSLTARGQHAVRWISRGRETKWEETSGAVNFTPFDGEQHDFVTAMSPDFVSEVFFIPDRHLRTCLASEGMQPCGVLHHELARCDSVLQSCMTRLARDTDAHADNGDSRKDEAARRLVLRLVELNGGGVPDWNNDASKFSAQTMQYLVDYIDEHLLISPSLSELGMRVGLSPSHFARKFRQSTGLSLHRFINRRRVSRSLDILKASPGSLASVAIHLGFSSQSHFTRLFSNLTGMTPAKYQKQFRRTVG